MLALISETFGFLASGLLPLVPRASPRMSQDIPALSCRASDAYSWTGTWMLTAVPVGVNGVRAPSGESAPQCMARCSAWSPMVSFLLQTRGHSHLRCSFIIVVDSSQV